LVSTGGPITVLVKPLTVDDFSDEAGAEWSGRPERHRDESGTNDRAEVRRTRPIRNANKGDMLLLGNTIFDASLPESLTGL
jgi:hypothetical protein